MTDGRGLFISLRTVCDWWVPVRGIEKFSVEVLEHGIVTGFVLLTLEKIEKTSRFLRGLAHGPVSLRKSGCPNAGWTF